MAHTSLISCVSLTALCYVITYGENTDDTATDS